MTWGMIGGAAVATVGGALLSKHGGSQQAGTATQTQQQELDPRMQSILYGDKNGSSGLLDKVTGIAGTPQTPGMRGFGGNADSYLGDWGMNTLMNDQRAAGHLEQGNTQTPMMGVAEIRAPSQNGIDLSGAYSRMINGDAGANPYLTKALQSAVDQTNASYQKNQTDLTNNLQRNILPGIGSDAVLAGQYGGTRQGIAQGNAISDYTNQLNNGNLQLGLANSANTTGQQANAYNQGQDRALQAMQGLSAQQYGTAAQAANLWQQGLKSNQDAQLSTNQLNSANMATGAGLSSGILNQIYGYGTANQNYDPNRTAQAANTLAPFTGLGGSASTSTPYYTNPVGNAVGGATAAMGLYNAFNQATGGGKSSTGMGSMGSLSDLFSTPSSSSTIW